MCCLQIYFSGGDAFGDNVTMADTATDTVDDVVTNDVARDAIASCLHGSIDDSDDDDVDSSYVSDTLIVSQVPDAVFEQQPAQVITGCSVSLSLLLRWLNARWCPRHISRDGSISSCPSPICTECRCPCCTSPLGRQSTFF